MTRSEPSARPAAAILMYSGWQVWDGQYGPVQVGGEFEASVEFVQRSAPESVDSDAEVLLEHTGADWYRTTARVRDTTDAVVLDLGPFRALRWYARVKVPGTSRRTTPFRSS